MVAHLEFCEISCCAGNMGSDPLKNLLVVVFGFHVDSMAKINIEVVYFSVFQYVF